MEIEQLRRELRKTDPYEILGVSYRDDNQTIKQSFKRLALKFHPDKNKLPGAKEVFSNITNAYDILIKNRSHSLPHQTPPPQPQTKHFHRQYQEQRQSYDQRFNPPKTSFTREESFKGRTTWSSPQQQNEFASKMFDMFKDITAKMQKQADRKREAMRQQEYLNRRRQNNLYQQNRRPYQPPPVIMILLLLFLGLFFAKSNLGSGIGMGFRSSRLSYFGMNRMGAMRKINIPMMNPRQQRNQPKSNGEPKLQRNKQSQQDKIRDSNTSPTPEQKDPVSPKQSKNGKNGKKDKGKNKKGK